MAAEHRETIAAIATPPGRGGVGIIRISGPLVRTVIDGLIAHPLLPREARYTSFRETNGDILDQGLALFFMGPSSYTGEDCLELQAHGNPLLLDRLLALNHQRHAEEVAAAAAQATASPTKRGRKKKDTGGQMLMDL